MGLMHTVGMVFREVDNEILCLPLKSIMSFFSYCLCWHKILPKIPRDYVFS